MIANLIRKALAPTINNILNEERTRLNAIIDEMENILDDVKSISASDIADNINTYDIASNFTIDASDIADNISTYDIAAAISIDASDIASNITIDASDLAIDYRDLSSRIASEINCDDGIRINTIERKMDLILKYLGITPENA